MATDMKLKRRFGFVSCVAILVGFIVGSSIYVAPSGVLRNVTSPGVALMLWVIAGVVSLLGALTNAELGTTYPTSGDKYVYLQEFYGDFFGFLHLWQYVLIARPASNAIKCIIFAQHVLYPVYAYCDPPKSAQDLLAILFACAVTGINCINVNWAAKLQTFCASIAVAILLIISTSGFVYIGQGHAENLSSIFSFSGDLDFAGISLAFYTLIFTYGGSFALNYMIEELKNPYRDLPRAMVVSLTLVTCLYVMVNVAYLGVLGTETVMWSDAVALTFSVNILGAFSWVIAILIAINLCGTMNAGILVGSRLCFAGARQGHFPLVLALINIKSRSPVTALLLQHVLIVAMCLLVDLYTLLNNVVFLNTCMDMLVTFGLLYRRYKEPQRHRPLKLPIVIPAIYALVSTVMVFGPLITIPWETCVGLVIVLCTGVPYYVVFVRKVFQLRFIDKYNYILTQAAQKLLFSVPEYRGKK